MKERVNRTAPFSMILVMFLLMLALTVGCSLFNEGKTDEIQKNMADYLKNTYGKDFVVIKPKVSGNEFIGFNNYLADAYPKDQPDLKFGIIWNKNKPEVFQDNYLGAKWSKQGTVEMEKKLKEVYGDNFWLEEYWLSYNDKRVKDLDYPEVIKRYADRMKVVINYFVFIDGELDKKHEAERAYKILKENLIDLKTMQYFLDAGFLVKNKKDVLFHVYNSTQSGDRERAMPVLYENGILINWLHVKYTKSLSEKNPEVKDTNDVVSKFKY